LQARVLATASESIRVITALVCPILPESASKVWRQLGQGEIADAAKQAFLTNLTWGGLKPGTKFGEPAPLFPRAEKDAVDRMQNLEDENSRSAIDAASQAERAPSTAPEAPPSSLPIAPAPPPASPSVNSVQNPSNEPGAGAPQQSERSTESKATTPTHAPVNPEKPTATTHVNHVPAELASSRLSTTPAAAPTDAPLDRKENAPDPSAAPTQPAHITIDDFVKVDLRVAQILVAERVPKADKLLRLEVDLGYEKRQILAGIAQYYEPEKLIGRKIVIVANLAPRKMRGLESNGMLLAASLPPDGSPVLAGFLEDVPLGARLK
jgi:methionyl-tRNA synthetase